MVLRDVEILFHTVVVNLSKGVRLPPMNPCAPEFIRISPNIGRPGSPANSVTRLEQKHAEAGLGSIASCAQSGIPGTYNYHVVCLPCRVEPDLGSDDSERGNPSLEAFLGSPMEPVTAPWKIEWQVLMHVESREKKREERRWS
jgi:hypothetical protein